LVKLLVKTYKKINELLIKTNASNNDTTWTSYHSDGYKVSVMGGNLYYNIKTIIKIEADDPKEMYFFGYEDGVVEPIKNGWFYITPKKTGSTTLLINKKVSFNLQVIQKPDTKSNSDGYNK
ncbi:MAG TPA: hypothetical protein PKK00_07535, partial [Bacteroidales bacterium]|nr:hypothetical protein [Bacteroidales bacterium]HPS17271.1 hypothetical protein [Bacteroidales bacterium]